jgi:3D (Asp-Asp-Asp) domain-containing protein
MTHRPALTAAVCALIVAAACVEPLPPSLEVLATAYCTQGTTRSGSPTRRGIIAADPRVLPLGSVVRIEGLDDPERDGRYVVADTGGAIRGNRIDIFMRDCRTARRFGRQDAQLWVLEHAEDNDDESS